MTRLERIEEKIDLLIEGAAIVREEGRVHAAVCDADRADLRADVQAATAALEAQRGGLLRLALAVAGAGGVGAGAVEIIRALI